MSERFKIFIRYFSLSLCLSSAVLNGQMLRDTTSLNLIKNGINYIYNFQFDKASEVYSKISQSHPGHPIVLLYKGMLTYWKNYPLIPGSAARASYEEDLRKCIELCEKKSNPEDVAEYLLADLCARGLLLLFYADNDMSSDVIPLAANTYQYIRHSFDYTSVYPDFKFFTGIYNYYREAYPEAHPIYKAFVFIFPKGDKAEGLRQLKNSAENSIVLKAESYSFLSVIQLNFENNYMQASNYNKSLHELYPANVLYLAEYIKSLLLVKRYDEAERLMLYPGTDISNLFYQAQLAIFTGILQEKKYHDYGKAKLSYLRGIGEIAPSGDYGHDFAAFAYFGLSRISDINGDKQNKKAYRKQALKLADYKKIDFDN
jgi:hypothetical protein